MDARSVVFSNSNLGCREMHCKPRNNGVFSEFPTSGRRPAGLLWPEANGPCKASCRQKQQRCWPLPGQQEHGREADAIVKEYLVGTTERWSASRKNGDKDRSGRVYPPWGVVGVTLLDRKLVEIQFETESQSTLLANAEVDRTRQQQHLDFETDLSCLRCCVLLGVT